MGTRKECRERLGVIFTANGSFTAVYDYAPVGFEGASKVLIIYSDAARHEMISRDFNNNFYKFFLETYVAREGATAEDDLDTLHEVVRSVCRTHLTDSANPVAPAWNELNLEDESECFFSEVSGVPYRVERHSLLIKVSQA
jgi:hypothetical protein